MRYFSTVQVIPNCTRIHFLMDLRPDVDFENEKKLIGDGILESFDIMSLVAELEDEFDVKIKPKDLVAENFNSVDDMVAMLQKLGA